MTLVYMGAVAWQALLQRHAYTLTPCAVRLLVQCITSLALLIAGVVLM